MGVEWPNQSVVTIRQYIRLPRWSHVTNEQSDRVTWQTRPVTCNPVTQSTGMTLSPDTADWSDTVAQYSRPVDRIQSHDTVDRSISHSRLTQSTGRSHTHTHTWQSTGRSHTQSPYIVDRPNKPPSLGHIVEPAHGRLARRPRHTMPGNHDPRKIQFCIIWNFVIHCLFSCYRSVCLFPVLYL